MEEAQSGARQGAVQQNQMLHNQQHAGLALVQLARKDPANEELKMCPHEKTLLDECFEAGASIPDFITYHLRALRVALASSYFDIAHALLSKDATHQFLAADTDILSTAISSQCRSVYIWRVESSELLDMVESLVSYGASVDCLDAEGKSALYYTCTYGFPRIFKFLVKAGAACTTMHDPLVNCDNDRDSSQLAAPIGEPPKVNLLEIALDACLESEKVNVASQIWLRGLQDQHGDIIMCLVDAGLTVRRDNPALIKFFHIACFQGNMTYVEKLLKFGVSLTAPAARNGARGYQLGSCLHAAVTGGQKEIASLLLKHGADPCMLAICRLPYFDRHDLMTPISRAFHWGQILPIGHHKRRDILACCEVLVEAGADDEDCRILLGRAADNGEVGLVKRLLARGTRLLSLEPRDSCRFRLDIFQLLLEHGIPYDQTKLQRCAAEMANLNLLRLLRTTDGPLLDMKMSDFGTMANTFLQHVGTSLDRLEMIRYLVTDYGLDVNGLFLKDPATQRYSNLLQEACNKRQVNIVQVLLEEGADPECPGLPGTALENIKTSLMGSCSTVSDFAMHYMPIIRLLLRYSKGSQDTVFVSAWLPCAQVDERNSQKAQDAVLSLQPESMGVESEDVPDSKTKSCTVSDHRICPETATLKPCPWIEISGSPFSYKPLESRSSIRLMELEPSGSSEDPIRCHFLCCDLSQDPQFEVLSYASNDKSGTMPISMDDRTFDATTELYSALCRVRHDSKAVFLWAFDVCINHDDVEEKNQQVGMLQSIFRAAQQTLVWLGETEAGSDIAFKYLNAPPSKLLPGDSAEYAHRPNDALLKLYQRPWFSRVWSSQEVTWSRKTIVMCGQFEVDWNVWRGSFRRHNPEFDAYHPLEGMNGHSHLYDMRSSLCPVMDPRDKIYASLISSRKPLVSIDYGASVVDVYREYTQAGIQSSEELTQLHEVGTRRAINTLPSWVPDYSVSDRAGVLPRAYGGTYRIRFPSKTLPGLQFRGSEMLIRGMPLESISGIADELTADSTFVRGSQDFAQVMFSWESLAARLTNKRFPQDITDAFVDTIVADDTKDIGRQSRPSRPRITSNVNGFIKWYLTYGSGVLSEADKAYFDELDLATRWINACADSTAPQETHSKKDVEDFARRMEIVCYGRRLFITDKGSMGLAPPSAEVGDQIVFLPGGLYPFVLRPNQDGTYVMKGDCFLYDFDMYRLLDNKEVVEAREFVIR